MQEPIRSQLAACVMMRCDELAACSEQPDALTRRFATPALRAAVDKVAGWMRAAGLEVREDAVGNVIGRRAGQGPGVLMLGSHLDTVRDAGRYDGPLGVIAALAALEALGDEDLPFSIELYGFADEEGTRYGTAYLGSAAVAGRFEPDWLERLDADGIAMATALRAYGGDPDAIAAAQAGGGELWGYVELHIEQGPVLEAHDLPLGVVTAITGQTRLDLELCGQAGHAGTVPMELRRDALCAAAASVLAVEAIAAEVPGLVATVGEIAAHPGAANVVPGSARLSIDVRHADDSVRALTVERIRARCAEIAAARQIEPSWQLRFEQQAVACDRELTAALEHAVQTIGLKSLRLASGAGHDAAQLAAIAPIAMLFVRCAGGISHNPAEAVAQADVAVAVAALERFLRALAAAPLTPTTEPEVS